MRVALIKYLTVGVTDNLVKASGLQQKSMLPLLLSVFPHFESHGTLFVPE